MDPKIDVAVAVAEFAVSGAIGPHRLNNGHLVTRLFAVALSSSTISISSGRRICLHQLSPSQSSFRPRAALLYHLQWLPASDSPPPVAAAQIQLNERARCHAPAASTAHQIFLVTCGRLHPAVSPPHPQPVATVGLLPSKNPSLQPANIINTDLKIPTRTSSLKPRT